MLKKTLEIEVTAKDEGHIFDRIFANSQKLKNKYIENINLLKKK